MSPCFSWMTSPATSSRTGGVTHFPSRFTRVLVASLAFRVAMALPAERSSQNPTTALVHKRTRIMKKSGQCFTTPDRITATSIIQGIGPQKYERNFSSAFVFFTGSSFGPSFVSRFDASAPVRPSGEDSSRFSTSASGSVFKSSAAFGLPFALGVDCPLASGVFGGGNGDTAFMRISYWSDEEMGSRRVIDSMLKAAGGRQPDGSRRSPA